MLVQERQQDTSLVSALKGVCVGGHMARNAEGSGDAGPCVRGSCPDADIGLRGSSSFKILSRNTVLWLKDGATSLSCP